MIGFTWLTSIAAAQAICGIGTCTEATWAVLEPDALIAVSGATYTLTQSGQSSCDPWIFPTLDGLVDGLSVDPFFVWNALNGTPLPFDITVDVAADVDASFTGVDFLQ